MRFGLRVIIMGYSTDFEGLFRLDRPLTPDHRAYLLKFSETRRMRRDPAIAEQMPDPERVAVGLPLGPERAYFVGGTGFAGQDHDPSILDYNEPPERQPGLWCQWEPNEAGDAIRWNGAEMFYDYVKWLEYLIAHFLEPWGYLLTGEVLWQGEDVEDRGVILVEDNRIRTQHLPPSEGRRREWEGADEG
jgi:hypothetical protein